MDDAGYLNIFLVSGLKWGGWGCGMLGLGRNWLALCIQASEGFGQNIPFVSVKSVLSL